MTPAGGIPGELLADIREIAKAIDITKRSAERKAKREEWPYREASGRGGRKRLYLVFSLPREVKEAVLNQRTTDAINRKTRDEAARLAEERLLQGLSIAEMEGEEEQKADLERIRIHEQGLREFNRLAKDDPRRQRAEARQWLCRMVYEVARSTKLSQRKALVETAWRVNHGHIEVPAPHRPYMPTKDGALAVSAATLKAWLMTYRAKGVFGLVPNWGGRKGKTKIDTHPLLRRLVLGSMIKYPQITGRAMKEIIAASMPELDVVSQRRIEIWMARWKEENPQVWTYMTHPDQWKSIYMPGVGSMFEQITAPNQMWELDSTPGDWLLTDGRHSVVGCIDLYSRRVKLFVSKSSSAAAVKQVLRRSMLDWGVPQAVRTDNGKDYVSEEVTGLLRELEIHQQICIPFASEEKGTVERFFRTMSHGVLNLLDGFIGHSVADRKAIEDRKGFAKRIMDKNAVVEVALSSDELQQKLDEWVEHYYEQSPHKGLNGATPRETWRAWSAPLRKISDPHALDHLMMEVAGTRVIGKKGVRWDNRYFIDPTGVMHEYIGRSVMLRLDEHDIGRLGVYLDGAFLCWAEDPDATGISRREAAAAIKGHVKKRVAEHAAELKQLTRGLKKDVVQTVIDHRKSQTENLIDLPKRSEAYTTRALEEAAKANQAQEPSIRFDPETGEVLEAEVVEYERFRGEFSEHNRAVMETEDNRKTHARWLRVEAAIEAGRLVSIQDRRGFELYWQSGQYQSNQEFFDAFGLTEEDFPE